jgi:hypothetical protein
MNAKFQRMIDIGKAYYGRIEQVLSKDRLQEIQKEGRSVVWQDPPEESKTY